jgi:hypothetical protein
MLKQLTYKGKQENKPLSSEYWATKTLEERIAASVLMTEFAFQKPKWWLEPMDKTVFKKRKRN